MRQLLTIAATVITIVIGLSVSLVAFAVLAFLGSIAGVYFWWKTRELRSHLKQHIAAHTHSQRTADEDQGTIIEGEWLHESPPKPTPESIALTNPLLNSATVDTGTDSPASTRKESSSL